MGVDNLDWRGAAVSTLDWWREAGVDCLVDDLPRDWLAAVAAPPAAAALRVEPEPAADDALPATLDTFLTWRGGAAAPEAGWRGASLPASGPADAAVMVLVDCPDRDDAAAGTLLAGDAGRLFDRMLAAVGLNRGAVHLAAVCARRPVAGRVPVEADARLAALARHHLGLVAPRRVLLLGNGAARAVMGAETAALRGGLRAFNHAGGTAEVVASFHPRFLLERPALKAEAWRDWRLLVEGLTR